MVSVRTRFVTLSAFLFLVLGAAAAVAQDKGRDKLAESAAELASGRAARAVDAEHARFIQEAAERGIQAMQDPGSEEDRAFYKQQESVDRYTEEHREWLEAQVDRTRGIAERSIEDYGREVGIVEDNKAADGPYFLVFVSQSMGKEGLRQAFAYGAGRSDVAYAFIGYGPDQTHMSFFQAIQQIIGQPVEGMDVPSVMLNPPAFTENGITRVPAIVKFDQLGNPIAKVEGVANPQWLEDRIGRDPEPSYGQVGEVYAIHERNLIDAMKERAAAFDYEAESKKAVGRFFEELATQPLPYATETRRREMLAKMVVQDDIVDHEGVVRHYQGEEISMVDEMPMAPVLVIFNANDPYHVEFAKSVIPRYPDRNVILMTTDVDRDAGFGGYIKREVELGRPVYLLTPEVRTTFRIEKVPTLVTPLEDRFAIVEVPLLQGEEDHGPRSVP